MVDSDHQLTGSLNRNSRYSHKSFAPSTHSWVHDPKIPLPQPINLPTPVQTLRPLPDPHVRQNINHNRGPLHVVNTPGPSEHAYATYEADLFQPQPSIFNPSFGALRPRKKRSFVGGFVKGIRRLPKTVFGYGAGVGFLEKNTAKHHDDSEGREIASTDVTVMSTGNTLPGYTSNPPTPVLADPKHSGTSSPYRPQVVLIPESPLPAVVRLDDQKRLNPTFRVSPPHVDDPVHEDNVQFFAADGNHFEDHSNGVPYSNPTDRTTVILYNERDTQYDRTTRVPVPSAPIVSRELSSPGLSYASSEHPGSIRPLSFHSNHRRAPTPIDIPQTGSVSSTGPQITYPSQAPTPRATPPALIPGAIHSSSSSIHAHAPSEAPQLQTTDPVPIPGPNAIHSPVSVHPTPGADYLKMTHSPSPTSHGTITTGTSYYDPSFSSALNPVEKFFKTLYHMPWISHDRVTVDYHPGDGLGKMKKNKFRPATSWYQSILLRSGRSSTSLGLLSRGSTEPPVPNSLGMAFGSPIPANTNKGRTLHSDKTKIKHHQLSSRRHRHHSSSNNHHRRRKRDTATTIGSTNTGANEPDLKPAVSPLVPSLYPFHYPYSPYPYPSFPTFPMAAYTPLSGQEATRPIQTQTRSGDATSHRGEQQQPLAMYAPAGYTLTPYQSMIAPQVYVLSSPTKAESSVLPSAPITRFNSPEQLDGNEQAQGNQSQSMLTGHSGMLYVQPIPGAFS